MHNVSDQIIQETQAFAVAWSSADAKAAAEFFTKDGVRNGAFGDVQRGRAEIEAAYRRLLTETMAGASLKQDVGEVRMLSPELALWQGNIEITPSDGERPLRGHVLQVMRKVGDRWLILEAHPKIFPNPLNASASGQTVRNSHSDPVGLTMQSEVSGEGPPAVLIGGGLTGWKSWEPHAQRLAADRTVARLQLISVQYGLEGRPLPEGYSVRMESEALAGSLDDLGWKEPVDLVAWSYGGLITLDFALNHPERVRSLTLIEPPAVWLLPDHGRHEPAVESLLELARSLDNDVSEGDLERFVCDIGLCPPGMSPQELPSWDMWMQHRRSLLNATAPFDHSDDVSRIRAFDRPVLLVTGTGTAPFLRRIHDALAAGLPNARSVELPAGHAPHLVSMDRFLTELSRFHKNAVAHPTH